MNSYVECHTSFTWKDGVISTDVNEFDVCFIKGQIYKLTKEHNSYCWIKYVRGENYGPGGRFTMDNQITIGTDNLFFPIYTNFFLTPKQTKRNQKLNKILNDI